MFLILKLITLSLLVTSCSSKDFRQNLPDQLKNDSKRSDWLNDIDGESSYISGMAKDSFKEISTSADYFSGSDEIQELSKDHDFSALEKSMVTGGVYPLQFENSKKFHMPNPEALRYSVRKKATKTFFLGYRKDSLDVYDDKNSFNRVFNDSENSSRYGFLSLKSRTYIYRGIVDLDYGMGLAVSYSRAKAKFSSGEVDSRTTISLWNVPFDLSLGLSIRPCRFFAIRASAGGIASVLIQNRSDFANEDDGKVMKQAGFGYFYEGAFQLSITDLSSNYFMKMHRLYDVTKMYLDFLVRYEDVEGFKEKIQINGVTFGLGITFEYF